MTGIGSVIALAGALNATETLEPQFNTTPAQAMEVSQSAVGNCLDMSGRITSSEQNYIRDQAQGRSFTQLSDIQTRIEQAKSGNFDIVIGGNCLYVVLGEGEKYGRRYILVKVANTLGMGTEIFL